MNRKDAAEIVETTNPGDRVMDKPKTWLQSEVQELIKQEIRDYRLEISIKSRPFSARDLAELIYVILDHKGLIEHQPTEFQS